MQSTPTQNTRLARPVLITSLVSALAAGLTGCSSGEFLGGGKDLHSPEGQARLATATIDPDGRFGSVDQDFFQQQGRQVQLPSRWVGEAVAGTTQTEARRASAQSAFVSAEATFSETTSDADATFQRALSDRESAGAFADRMSTVYNAKASESEQRIEAAQIAGQAEHTRREHLLSASVQEWQSEVERMRSQAESEWSQALAEHDRMLAEREAVLSRGGATISQMNDTADITERRAAERVAELRNASRAVADQTKARVADLTKRSQTVGEQTRATVSELTARAESVRVQSSATVEQMIADAAALEAQDTQERYRLAVIAAQVEHDNKITEAEQLRAEAHAKAESDSAEAARRNAANQRELELARVMYDEAMDSIAAAFERGMADVSVTRAEADRVERDARGRFVQAEIDARVAAAREQATHDVELSKAEREKIAAEAEAEARRAEAKLKADLAARFVKNSTTLPGNDAEQPRELTPQSRTPELTRAGNKPAVVEPARIAAFRTQLAEASRIRQQAQADEQVAIANRDERRAEFDAWFTGKQADFDALSTRIAAIEHQAQTETEEIFSRAESLVAAASAERQRATVDAESLRQATIARITALRSGAEAERKKAAATVDQLLAQAESTRRTGQSEIESLTVQRDSTQRRGEAQSRQMLAEADSLEQGQRAVVAQMRQEVESAKQVLTAELDRLDGAAQAFVAIAEANYNEAVALANTFERITVANTAELAAAHAASRKQALATVEHMRTLTRTDLALGEADVARRLADANAELGLAQAADVARRGTIEAERVIGNAAAKEQLEIAAADEAAVLARFNARIVQTEAERNRAYADQYLARVNANNQATRAVADAAAHADLANAAMARLNAVANSFARTAAANWDSRLALPTPFPAVVDRGTVGQQSQTAYPDSSINLYNFDNNQNWVVVPTETPDR